MQHCYCKCWEVSARECRATNMQLEYGREAGQGCLGLRVAPRRARNCRPLAAAHAHCREAGRAHPARQRHFGRAEGRPRVGGACCLVPPRGGQPGPRCRRVGSCLSKQAPGGQPRHCGLAACFLTGTRCPKDGISDVWHDAQQAAGPVCRQRQGRNRKSQTRSSKPTEQLTRALDSLAAATVAAATTIRVVAAG